MAPNSQLIRFQNADIIGQDRLCSQVATNSNRLKGEVSIQDDLREPTPNERPVHEEAAESIASLANLCELELDVTPDWPSLP